MREIKFRAWDNEKEEWVYNPESGYIEIKQDDKIEFDYDEDRIVLQQYTGLKDKNGKEIYEGDIGRYKTCAGPFFISVVEWFKYGFFCGDYPISEHIEVIGNIHENPELLEDK